MDQKLSDPNKSPLEPKTESGLKKPVYLTKPWHFDPLTKKPKVDSSMPYQLLEATSKDKRKVVGFYQHHSVPGYEVGSVEVIYNQEFDTSFALQIKRLQRKHDNSDFAPTWQTENSPKWREKVHKQCEALSKPYVDNAYSNVKVLPTWHGTKPEKLDSIFKTGYENLGTTDTGYYGKGIYSTYEAEYAYRIYSQGPNKKIGELGEGGALILNWVAFYSAYPVIDGDKHKLEERGNYRNYDAHFIPVTPITPTIYYPCKKKGDPHTYQEIVVFNSAACLPRYLVKLTSMAPQPNKLNATLLTNPQDYQTNQKPALKSEGNLYKQSGEEEYEQGNQLYMASRYRESIDYFEQAGLKGYPAAYLRLSGIYQCGLGVSINTRKSHDYFLKVADAIEWFQEEARKELPAAQYNLGLCYARGCGAEQDEELAVQYLQLAANLGISEAQFTLGIWYAKDQRFWDAAKCFELGANQGNALAQFMLGLCYEYGEGVDKDEEMAMKYYQLAGDQGHIETQFMLGVHYLNLKGLVILKDDEMAVKYFQLAADQGFARAQFCLGVCYANGVGVEKDEKLAMEYYQLASDQGHVQARTLLEKKQEADEDDWLERIVKRDQLAADQGDAEAQYSLGKRYEYGNGVEKDEEMAMKYYQLAADQGHTKAKFDLELKELLEKSNSYQPVFSPATQSQSDQTAEDQLVPNENTSSL